MASEIDALAVAWNEELARVLSTRSAWAHLGKVEVVSHRGMSTLGGYIDRRVVPVPQSEPAATVLDTWRHSSEGRLVDRALVRANNMLYQRLLPPARLAALTDDWLGEIDRGGPIVALGTAADLVVAARVTRGHALRDRLHACAVEGRGGVFTVISGSSAACTMIAVVSASLAPDGVHVVTVLDVKTRGSSKLNRVDVRV